jgi:hypothetical protein
MENSYTHSRKITWRKNSLYCGFLQITHILRWKVAIQHQVIKTRNYEKHCLQMEVRDKYRKCIKVGKTTEHIIAGCPSLSESTQL